MLVNDFNKRKLGKKGIFLTFIAISTIAALLMVFMPSDIGLRTDLDAVKTRVSNINDYVSDVGDVYLERALYASGTKALIALSNYTQYGFLPEFEYTFRQVLLNGTINDPAVHIDSIIGNKGPDDDIINGSALNDLLHKINKTAKDAFNVETSFVINSIDVYQDDPWFVNIEANVSYLVSSETASWNRNVRVKTEIGIENFNDPYYMAKTAGAYINRINKSNIIQEEWNLENVSDHIKHGTYVHWQGSLAPSFLQRFTNELDSPTVCCGIQSIVNPDKIPPSYPDDVALSYADYMFFDSLENPPDCADVEADRPLYAINGLDPRIKLDSTNKELYSRTLEAQRVCPPVT